MTTKGLKIGVIWGTCFTWANPVMSEGLLCRMERDCTTIACRAALAEGLIHIIDTYADIALTPVLATKGLIPGDIMPDSLAAQFGWQGDASAPAIKTVSVDAQTGAIALAIPPATAVSSSWASLIVSPEGPQYNAELLVSFGIITGPTPITYSGHCETIK